MELNKYYYSIKEVSEIADVKPYIIRYWESEFKVLKPRRMRGRRKYTLDEVKLILLIKKLLYEDRFTIEGAKKRLKELKKHDRTQLEIPFAEFRARKVLPEIKRGLREVMDILR